VTLIEADSARTEGIQDMTGHAATDSTIHGGQETLRLPLRPWVIANALGLGVTFALFALVGGSIESMGAEHDSVARNLPAIIAMVLGGTVFAQLRRSVLRTHYRRSVWQMLVIGIGIAAGFVAGFMPPLDFIVSSLAAGMIGGAFQLREVRRRLGRPRSLLVVGAGAWLVAGVAAVAAAVLVADVILVGALGLTDEVDGVGGFVAILALVGLVSGAVGAAIEGAAMRHLLARST
jgi:hypothetical protein